MYVHTEALSLSRLDFKERASRYVLLTREHGKIEARMDGARNIHSKLSGHVEPVSLSEVYLIKGRSGYKMIQTELIKRFIFSQDPQLAFVWHVIETMGRLLPEQVLEEKVFELFLSLCYYLEQGGMVRRGVWGYVYLQLLAALGYFPGNLLLTEPQRRRAEELLSLDFSNGILKTEQEEEIITLTLNTVKEILQTENKSSGYLKETLRDSNIRMHTNATNKN